MIIDSKNSFTETSLLDIGSVERELWRGGRKHRGPRSAQNGMAHPPGRIQRSPHQ
jgi:hypothetical protein